MRANSRRSRRNPDRRRRGCRWSLLIPCRFGSQILQDVVDRIPRVTGVGLPAVDGRIDADALRVAHARTRQPELGSDLAQLHPGYARWLAQRCRGSPAAPSQAAPSQRPAADRACGRRSVNFTRDRDRQAPQARPQAMPCPERMHVGPPRTATRCLPP